MAAEGFVPARDIWFEMNCNEETHGESAGKVADWMHDQGIASKAPNEMTVHVIASSLINAFAEIIIHKIPKENAVEFIKNINNFFHYGTMHMMGIIKSDNE